MSGTRAISTKSRRELSSSFFSCKARRRRKFTQFWQKHYLVSFLVGLGLISTSVLLAVVNNCQTKHMKSHMSSLMYFNPFYPGVYLRKRPGKGSRYSASLQARRFGVRAPVGRKNFTFFTSVQAGPWAHPASHKVGTGPLSGGCVRCGCCRAATSAPYTRPTQRLSPPIQKLGAENHTLQLNV